MAAPMLFEDLPSYYNCAVKVYVEAEKTIQNSPPGYQYPLSFIRDVQKYGRLEYQDLLVVSGLAVVWTILRHFLCNVIFVNVAKYLKLTPQNVSKFPESAWKLLFYTCTFSYLCYLVLPANSYNFFRQPTQIWKDWDIGMDIPTDIQLIYWIEFGFYLHSVYAVFFMDQWRKDSLVMLFHHFLTMALIGFSYTTRYHKIGILVLFVHDVTDVCLEFTKCNVYLKDRDGKYFALNDHISTAGFISFTVTWFVFRLYWYPLKILYSAGWGAREYANPKHKAEGIPFFFFFNVMLWVLLVLNVYWFGFILKFLFLVVTGQIQTVEDTREFELDEKLKKPKNKDKRNMSSANGAGDATKKEK